MIKKLIEGLEIMVEAGAFGYCVQSEHDQIWAGDAVSDFHLTNEQKTRLYELGWFWDRSVGSWSTFV